MYPVLGKPFLDYQIAYLKKFGFKQFYISTGYQGHVIKEYYNDAENISCIHESIPLGTGGGILYASSKIKQNHFVVLNGDTLYLLDYLMFINQCIQNPLATTLALKQVEDVSRYGEVIMGDNYSIQSFQEKNTHDVHSGMINAGIYFINKSQLLSLEMPEVCSMETDIFPKLLSRGLYGFVSNDSFIDIGTPETLSEIEKFVQNHQLTL